MKESICKADKKFSGAFGAERDVKQNLKLKKRNLLRGELTSITFFKNLVDSDARSITFFLSSCTKKFCMSLLKIKKFRLASL